MAKIQGLELNGVAKKTHQKITRENFVSITMGFFIFYFEVVHAEENDMAYNAPIDTNCIGDEWKDVDGASIVVGHCRAL